MSETYTEVLETIAANQRKREERGLQVKRVLRSLRLFHPKPPVEIRALDVPGKGKLHTVAGYYDDLESAAKAVVALDEMGARGIYHVLNPINPAVLARSPNTLTHYPKHLTGDNEIERRLWLFVDIDPVRPDGVSATQEEVDTAVALAHDIEAKLREFGFPSPVLQSTGNGFALYYRVDLPNNADIDALVKRFYRGLNELLPGVDPSKPHAKIDLAVGNAARIVRCSHTLNRKGAPTADRPHRMAEVYRPDGPVQVVPIELLQKVAARAPVDKPNRSRNGQTSLTKPAVDVAAYLTDRKVAFTVKPDSGRTLYLLDECLFDPHHGSRGESSIIQADSGLLTYWCMHNSCQGRRWHDVVDLLGPVPRDHVGPASRNGKPRLDARSEAEKAADVPDAAQSAPAFTHLLPSASFAKAEYRPTFLVKRVLVAGQPAMIGGRSKTLKTSVACDLVLSLGSGTPFLNEFPTKQVNVGIWSGESGAATLQETFKRQAAARNVDPASCRIYWSFDLPRLSRLDHLDQMAVLIQQYALEVVVVDPLYLALLDADAAGDASNIFAMGAKLQPLSELGRLTGCTIILLHHFRKNSSQDAEPASLEELAQAGAGEWCRQWILLARRSSYQHDGRHELWMRVGGSAGHAGMWSLTIDEGTLDPETFTGRKWDVQVENHNDIRQATREQKTRQNDAAKEAKESDHQRRVFLALRENPNGETARRLRGTAKLNPDNFEIAIVALMKEGYAEECMVQKGNTAYAGYRLTEKGKSDDSE